MVLKELTHPVLPPLHDVNSLKEVRTGLIRHLFAESSEMRDGQSVLRRVVKEKETKRSLGRPSQQFDLT